MRFCQTGKTVIFGCRNYLPEIKVLTNVVSKLKNKTKKHVKQCMTKEKFELCVVGLAI